MSDLNELVSQAQARIAEAGDEAALDAVRVDYLGKKGLFTEQMKGLSKLSPEERPKMGAVINAAKSQVTEALNARKAALEAEILNRRLASETVDVTLPGRRSESGTLHPVTRTIRRIEEIFESLGFTTESGPEIEDCAFLSDVTLVTDAHQLNDSNYKGGAQSAPAAAPQTAQ